MALVALFLGVCADGTFNRVVVKASTIAEDPGPPAASVNLSAVANVVGIANTGSPAPDGGLDNDGYAYSATLLGDSLTWSGSTFMLGAAGVPDAVSSTTIALPAGNDSEVILLATAVNGNQANQTFTVTYTDGTTTSITQSLSDWYTPQSYTGESQALKMAYRIAPSGATSNGPIYLYAYSFAINGTRTVQSITLPKNRNVVVLAINLSPAGPSAASVNLSAVANVVGIANKGSPAPDGGLDNDGYAYSETLLGGSLVWSGSTFVLGAAGVPDAVSSTTIALPAGNDSEVILLATAVNGNQANQTFIVTYTDGTTTSITQSLSDWYTPQSYTGESQALKMAYRIAPSGATSNGPIYLYAYSFAITGTKSVRSITLPKNRNVVVLAINLSPAGPTAASVNLSAAANLDGLVTTGSPVSGGGVDGYGNAYSATLTGTSITWSGVTLALGSAGTANALSSKTIALPAGNFSRLYLLATGANGNQVNQTFVVTYTDGTSTTIVQSLSNWTTPQNYPGESMVYAMPYRLSASGATQAGPYFLYGYSLAINSTKTVQSIALPGNRNVVVFAITLSATYSNPACNPLNFGAIGDGTTDNTAAIQNAVNSCAAQGGGIVELSLVGNNAVYLTGPFRLLSNVLLEVDNGVRLQGTNDHSRYVAAYINWLYEPNEALISAVGATGVGIIGAGIIDGAGNQLQPDGSPSWWTLQEQNPAPVSARPYLIEFYQCDQVTISGVTLQNAPSWNQALRFSSNITESSVTINAPALSPNTDGVDVVGSTNVTLTNLDISVGDDNIAFKSGLPINPADPRQLGLPRMATSKVKVANIVAGSGDGIVIGSEASNGVNNITIQEVIYTWTSWGFRIKSGRNRGGQIYDVTVEDLIMNNVYLPIGISDYYPAYVGPTEPPYQAAAPITPTTPYVHDITIENIAATGAGAQSVIEGLPESCIRNVTLNNVSIQTSSLDIALRHMTGTFTNMTSTPAPPNPPFVVQENVSVIISGTTPAITDTPPQTGQIACSAQAIP
jgi:polygalacturonase